MARERNKTRRKIIEVADRLFYQSGYDNTSFAHIAAEVQISRGNFYHHFKSKEEILDEVVMLRIARTQSMLADWQIADSNPVERILSFINILNVNRRKIKQYGCPVGTLATELLKQNIKETVPVVVTPSKEKTVESKPNGIKDLFSLFRVWLRQQFIMMGYRPEESDCHALYLLAMSQGVATIANSLKEDDFIDREIDRMSQWVRQKYQEIR